MSKAARCLSSLLLLLASLANAELLKLPSGLQLDPPAEQDLTYQVIPDYDAQQRVIAAWHGESLQYYIATGRFAPGENTDPQVYFAELGRGLRSRFSGLEIGQQLVYKTDAGIGVTVVEFNKPDNSATLIAHLLNDGGTAVWANVMVASQMPSKQVMDETIALLSTAAFLAPEETPARDARSEDTLVGEWTTEEKRPDGGVAIEKTSLKDDLTFATQVALNGKPVFVATGTWSRSGDSLQWLYYDSKPKLPESKKNDEDEILSIEPSALVLKSKLSGKTRTLTRVEAAK